MKFQFLMAAGLVVAFTTLVSADVVVTQASSGPTYSTTLNFDEPGGPIGPIDPNSSFADYGITELQAGDGNPQVGDFANDHGVPWVGSGNSFFGNFGVFMSFENDLTEFSGEFWDPSGPPGPFGGGIGVFVFDDGIEVANYIGEPAWGGIGDPFINITTTAGSTFDEVRVLGFGFTPTTYADNLSWNSNSIPEPGSLLMIGAVALTACFRRRR